MTIGKFIIGMIIIAIGFLIVWKSEWLLINFGRIGWAEKHLGTGGGSRAMYKLIGSLIIVFGLLYATDLTNTTLKWLVNSIFKPAIPQG